MFDPPCHTAAGDRWRENLHRPDGSLSPRVADLEAERRFWAGRGPTPPDPYSAPVWRQVLRLGREAGAGSVLEIGPGWGNYTFRLARAFPQVTCLDLSPDNLEGLRQGCQSRGLSIETICAPWEEARLDRTYGMVFAYNCFYRLLEPELFLSKLDRSADRLCLIGMNRPPELPWLPALERAGLPVHYTRQGCPELARVLVSLGIHPRRLDIPNLREYRCRDEGALLERVRGFLTAPVPDRDLLPLVLPFYTRQPDGSLLCRYSFQSQLLAWTPTKGRRASPSPD